MTKIPPADRQPGKNNLQSATGSEDAATAEEKKILKVLYLGHINESKGVPLLIGAANVLDYVQIDAYGGFVCKEGKELSEQHFVGHKVHYRGEIQPSQVLETLKQYDVLVLPTHYSGEGYPGVIIEAKCSGLAVISTRWRSIPEIVNHNEDGLLIEPGNRDELIAAIQLLSEDRALLDNLRRGSYVSFENFDSRRWCTVLLQHLLGTNQPGVPPQ